MCRARRTLPRCKGAGISCLRSEHLVAIVEHAAVVEGHFQGCGKVDVGAAGGVGVSVGMARFRAAGDGIVIGLVQGHTLESIEGNDFLVIDELGIARAVLDGEGNLIEEATRSRDVHPLGNCACHAHKEKVRLSHGLADFLHFVEHCLGGGGESRTPVRERSTQSFYRLRTSLDLVPPGAGAQAPKEPASRTILAKAPVGTCFRQPNEMRPTRVIGRPP